MSRFTKILVAVLLLILIGVIIATMNFYFDISKSETDMSSNTEYYPGTEYPDKGVNISSDRYIVSKEDGISALFGIIDKNENIIIPFIYEKIQIINRDVILGTVAANKNSVIFDISGNPYIAAEWDTCDINDSAVKLTKDGSVYSGSIQNGRLVFTDITMKKAICGKDVSISVPDVVDFRTQTYSVYNEIADKSIECLTAVFDDDASTLKKLARIENYRSVQAFENKIVSHLDDKTLKSVVTYADSMHIGILLDDNGILQYLCTATIECTAPLEEGEKITSETKTRAINFQISFRKNENGLLTLTRVTDS